MAELRKHCQHGPQSHHPGCRHDPMGPLSSRPSQERLTGFPRPTGLDEARSTIDAANEPEAPLHGPQRPRDATLGLYKNRRAHFADGARRAGDT